VLLSKTGFLLPVRRIKTRIVVDLTRTTDACMERLRGVAVPPHSVRIQQIAALLGERQAAVVVAKIDGLDKAFVAEIAQGVLAGFEFVFGHDSERADGGQRAAVLAIQLVHTVAIDDQLALLAARQVEVVHQSVARIVIVSVALVVHARALVAIARSVLARIIPSSVRHRALLARVALFGLSVKTPWQFLRGAIREAPRRRGFAAAIRAWSFGNPASEPLRRSSEGLGPRYRNGDGPAADRELLRPLYAHDSSHATRCQRNRSRHTDIRT
jgi:hypothetical protein